MPSQLPDPAHHQLQLFAAVSNGIATAGWCVIPEALPAEFALQLRARAASKPGYFDAGVGRDSDHQQNRFVRRDRVVWISAESATESAWLAWMDTLRIHLNRTLLLGLFEFESHFAWYAPGAFYRRHVDAFKGEANRVLSVVCYLNDTWQPGDGGELVLYDPAGDVELGRFAPRLGTLAVFLSEEFPHEVLPARSERYSIAGWYRVRPRLPLQGIDT